MKTNAWFVLANSFLKHISFQTYVNMVLILTLVITYLIYRHVKSSNKLDERVSEEQLESNNEKALEELRKQREISDLENMLTRHEQDYDE